ncbi:MAG: hypothetical protein RLO81_17520 [Fulvivirga sp.]|uniref:hypothetical protein n=1 Tax=Fulvivirga sp. TaxID=1931237 RepID=UPI0032EEFEDD
MKARLLLPSLIISISLVSCSKDDDPAPPPHEVGTWNLSSYALKNVPGPYSYNENAAFELDEVTLGITSYELTLNQDLTYSRTIAVSGSLPQDDNGTWVADELELTLDSEDFDDNEIFDIQKNENDDLWISFPLQFLLLKNAIADTLSNEYVSELTNEEFNALFDPVSVDFVLVFDRE